eukprot:7382591-Prymnesium_polylepis.1
MPIAAPEDRRPSTRHAVFVPSPGHASPASQAHARARSHAQHTHTEPWQQGTHGIELHNCDPTARIFIHCRCCWTGAAPPAPQAAGRGRRERVCDREAARKA